MSSLSVAKPTTSDTRVMSLAGSALALTVLAAFALSMAAIVRPTLLFAAVGVWAAAILLVPPACLRHGDLYSPWSFLALSVLIGMTLRGFYISAEYPDAHTINDLFLRGERPDFFVWPSVTLLIGLAALASGYLLGGRVSNRPAGQNLAANWRFYPVVFLLLIISLASTYYYVKFTGGTESGMISAKRTVISNVDLSIGDQTQSFGILRLLASLAIYAHLLVLGDYLRVRQRRATWKLGLAGVLFLSACALPFYASSKSTIAIYLCMTSAMVYYGAKKLPLGRIVALGTVALLLIHVMANLRRSSEEGISVLLENPLESELVASLTLNRNNCGTCKTAHIMDAVGKQLDVEYGQTMWVWFVAPIPRSMWAEKPMIHSGPIIGNEVFGTRVSGVPPGFIAELYWNFYSPGVIIGCLLFGWALRVVYERLRPTRGANTLAAALYVAGPMYLGFPVIGGSLGAGIFDVALGWAVTYLLLRLLCDKAAGARQSRLRVLPAAGPIHRAAA